MSNIENSSPKINILMEKIKSGDTDSISQFWRDIERYGSPLIEEIHGDDENVLITFLYKGDSNVKNILIYGSFPGFRYEENIMGRVLDTDIWYRTYIIKNNVKFKYNFSLNYDFDNDYKKIKEKSILDSLNFNKIVFAKDNEISDSTETMNSLVVLPKAKKDIWTGDRAGIEKGKVELHRILNLDNESSRRVWVYTPFDYKNCSEKFNLLVLTDGFDYLNYLSAKEVLDNLIDEKKIPSTVCVLIDNSINRFDELTCNENFSYFIGETLMPWIWKNYSVSTQPEKTIIGGVSLGGLNSTYLAFKYPKIF